MAESDGQGGPTFDRADLVEEVIDASLGAEYPIRVGRRARQGRIRFPQALVLATDRLPAKTSSRGAGLLRAKPTLALRPRYRNRDNGLAAWRSAQMRPDRERWRPDRPRAHESLERPRSTARGGRTIDHGLAQTWPAHAKTTVDERGAAVSSLNVANERTSDLSAQDLLIQ